MATGIAARIIAGLKELKFILPRKNQAVITEYMPNIAKGKPKSFKNDENSTSPISFFKNFP